MGPSLSPFPRNGGPWQNNLPLILRTSLFLKFQAEHSPDLLTKSMEGEPPFFVVLACPLVQLTIIQSSTPDCLPLSTLPLLYPYITFEVIARFRKTVTSLYSLSLYGILISHGTENRFAHTHTHTHTHSKPDCKGKWVQHSSCGLPLVPRVCVLFILCIYLFLYALWMCICACVTISWYFPCVCVCVCQWVFLIPAVFKLSLWETGISSEAPRSSQGSQQRSELRCQEGRFRDNNSPPAQTPGHFSHCENRTNTHQWLCTARGRASIRIYLSLLHIFTLYLTCFPASLSSSLSFFCLIRFFPFTGEKTGSPLGAIKVSHYHSDISWVMLTDVGDVSVSNMRRWEWTSECHGKGGRGT